MGQNVFEQKKGLRIVVLIIALLVTIGVPAIYTVQLVRGFQLKNVCTETTTGKVYHEMGSGSHSLLANNCSASFTVDGNAYFTSGRDTVKHRLNDDVIVHYNPDDPSQAYAADSPKRMDEIFAGLFVFAGAMTTFAMIRSGRRAAQY
ncbi:MAG: DUF3592 domain-containing protein [Clostridia bacterium]|nr:DUF3592 domain-containing protein [Clostridia bacterium]